MVRIGPSQGPRHPQGQEHQSKPCCHRSGAAPVSVQQAGRTREQEHLPREGLLLPFCVLPRASCFQVPWASGSSRKLLPPLPGCSPIEASSVLGVHHLRALTSGMQMKRLPVRGRQSLPTNLWLDHRYDPRILSDPAVAGLARARQEAPAQPGKGRRANFRKVLEREGPPSPFTQALEGRSTLVAWRGAEGAS